MWQRVWDEQGKSFQLLGIAQEAQGERYVRPFVATQNVSFPIIVDRYGALGAALGFRMVPSGFFVDPEGQVLYRHLDGFDIADPRVRWNLSHFLEGKPVQSPEAGPPTDREAMTLFAQGVGLYGEGHRDDAIKLWREALDLDPSNFLIRSQIWAAEHPERFYPVVDLDWQYLQLEREGYFSVGAQNSKDAKEEDRSSAS